MANKFEHTNVITREFTYQYLEEITDNFSDKNIIGSGGYGVVYKGVLPNGEKIALKKLYWKRDIGDTEFRNEFTNLMRAQHRNITQLVGYCYNLREQRVEHNGEYISVSVEERVLCFEYLPESLDKHITNISDGLDWSTRFKIIKGVCEGLNYLHNGSKDPIYHLDLKPDNILLDKNMIPKIGDFGLSKLFLPTQTNDTSQFAGTPGYMPPEYIDRSEITSKFDVFSLGVVIIRIMTGKEGFSREMSSQVFFEHVHENWGKRLQATMSSLKLEEVKTCIKIALKCVEVDSEKRPTIAEIVYELNHVGTAGSSPIEQVTNSGSKHAVNQNWNSGKHLVNINASAN
ncbi:cysteine-rich receptor-like protein kinase 26 [Triticum dicoccoides]|uniref:cysteine-rich receptor-like protein kinase 26 n=1 Tax=Triticum dicoccoides TaxID=85692 RepID=UPI001890BFBE|nr:cysteine-rich receptor-like protein kinase 26 [Triticum dicoccoides]